MTNRFWGDLETYSDTPITQGAHKYAETVEILLFAYAFNDSPVQVWDCTEDPTPPDDLLQMVALADEFWFHNSSFDRTQIRHAMHRLSPELAEAFADLSKWRDTLVQALAHGLPGALGVLCDVLGIGADEAKDKAGKQLIQLLCKPIPFRFPYARRDFASKAEYDEAKREAAEAWEGRATSRSHPAQWQQFKDYAGLDIAAMRAVHAKLPKWNFPNNARELDMWHLDQRINDRGMYIDLDLAYGALEAVDEAQAALRDEVREMTDGQVQSATQRDQLLLHVLEAYGIDLPDMKKATLERRIADPDIPEGLRELLRVRLSASTSSTSKYKSLINSVSSDMRLRGTKQYCGASRTGRWAGRIFQPDNLPSRGLLPDDQIEMGIQAMKDGTAGLLFGDVMKLASSAIRGCIAAPEGRKLVVADLSNIEGRGIAWLGGEAWKLDAFREFDTVKTAAGEWMSGPEYFALCRANHAPELALDGKGEPVRRGHDLYKMAYAKSFNVAPESVTKEQRQIGKVQELMLAYQGGVGAYVTGAATYGIDLEKMAADAQRFIPGEVWGQSNIMLEWHRSKGRDPSAQYGLSDRAWLVCEAFVLGWRGGHPSIKSWWHHLEDTVRSAIANPGETMISGKVKIRRDGAWLRIVLPSGRALCYPSPRIEPEKRKSKAAQAEEAEKADIFTVQDAEQSTGRTIITFKGVNQYSKKWGRVTTYAGKVAENITQAFARDVMAWNMPAVEAAGYDIILTVHDEIVSEAPNDPRYNPEHLAALLCAPPPWAPDMPLAAAGFESYRYKK